MKQEGKQVVIIGGGAAGFFAAINLAARRPDLHITVVEKGHKLLQKVKVSGGGRCNVTHACFEHAALLQNYPRGQAWLKKAFRHFAPANTVEWFARHGVALKTEADGRMFPQANTSQAIIDCLLQQATTLGVQLAMGFDVQQLELAAGGWRLTDRSGRQLNAAAVMVACGGISKASQLQWVTAAVPHTIIEPVPSLFTFNVPNHPITSLMGVSTPATVRMAGFKYESTGPVLITHWGLSGPAVLRLSAFAARHLAAAGYSYTVLVNWLPGFHETGLRQHMVQWRQQQGSMRLGQTPWLNLPQRLKTFLLEQAGAQPDTRWADLKADTQNALARLLCSYELKAQGKTTFKEEFVHAGGISLAEVNPDTMESRLAPRLFFGGEVLDVDGVTGGFNFQHAWTSGFVASNAMASSL